MRALVNLISTVHTKFTLKKCPQKTNLGCSGPEANGPVDCSVQFCLFISDLSSTKHALGLEGRYPPHRPSTLFISLLGKGMVDEREMVKAKGANSL